MSLSPVERTIELPDGSTRKYIISKFNAIAGRRILMQYTTSAVPKIGDYDTNESMMFEIMKFVSVHTGDVLQPLDDPSMIDNHVPDWETLAKLEWEVINYNVSFFNDGRLSTFLEDLSEKLPQLITQMLTLLSERSSEPTKPPSTS